mmetsp:Transcript_9964/g.12562  ORF Transcript_9964/g.12562 Transcript_9964/m.12562 type:complete len:276 (-) Transcript_9964:32-859(-)
MSSSSISRTCIAMKKRSCLFFLSSVVSPSWQNAKAFSTSSSMEALQGGVNSITCTKHHHHQLPEKKYAFLLFNQGVGNQRNQGYLTPKFKYRLASARAVQSQSQSYQFANPSFGFRKGDMIQVEVVKFGPLGATVEIIAHKSHEEKDLIPEDEEPLGYGLILQSEIAYFRSSRRGVDVVRGEILPAYVDWVREDGKVNITLRKPGGKGKAEDLGKIVMEKLQESSNNEIPIGDKSTPKEINEVLPGASKASFKRAVAALYKKKLVQPGQFTTKLM